MRKLALVAALAVVGCSDSNPVAPNFDETQQAINIETFGSAPSNAADHAFVYHEGLYHLIYIKGSNWQSGQGRVFGHATSPDMVEWTYHDDIDLKHPSWSPDHIWAPHIVLHDGVFYMYYTGVERIETPVLHAKQATGLATSTDLFNWTLHNGDGFLFDGTADFTMYEEAGVWDMDCRDPMVFRTGGKWYCLVTVKIRDPEKPRAIGVWTSDDLISWTPVDYLPVTATDYLAESSFMFIRDGVFHLFWTTGRIYHAKSRDLFGTYVGKEKTTIPGYAGELLKVGSRIWCTYIAAGGIIDFIDITNFDFWKTAPRGKRTKQRRSE